MNAAAIKEAVASVLSSAGAVDLTDRGAFAWNLVFLYHTMRASEHLLESAAARSTGRLHAYFTEHLKEEEDHAEWLADDLATVGIDAPGTSVPREVVEMVGSQYYLINHINPCMLLGYMVLMECFPKPLSVIDELELIHGTQLLRTLRFHAEHDVDHGDDVLAVIDHLTDAERTLVFQSAVQSASYFVGAIKRFG